EIIREAGIVGMGGAGFPAHIKFNPPKDKPIDCVIINGAECEPYLSSDHRSMLEQPADLIRGLEIVMKTVGAQHGIIAIEDNKTNAIEKIAGLLAKKKDIEVKALKTKYPQGSEKHIIKAVLGRTVPSGKLPADVGVVVTNVDTAISVKKALETGLPVIRRRVTVSGFGIKNPGVFSVRIGTPFSEIIEAAGGMTDDVIKVVSGGPMMGTQVFDTDVSVIKTTSGILALTSKETAVYQEGPCLRCGKCVSACPMNLMPVNIAAAGRAEDGEKAFIFNAHDCIECGCCAYSCPSRRNLIESVRLAKNMATVIARQKKSV
ncbi:MAG: electron transport complex subunit RsxC, partial [Clostridia bacterium]|nr:electron transport complex subunit RsxC [Clostridia bacterium]